MEKINLGIVSLARSTQDREKTHFTSQEKNLAEQLALLLFFHMERVKEDDPRLQNISETVQEAFSEAAAEEFKDVASLLRRAYRSVEKENVKNGVEGWPKQRDPGSIQLIFRSGVERTRVISKEELDSMFPKWGAKKTA